MKQKAVLTIAGSDSSGGAGIQADLKTMEAHDVYGMSVITALTAQNTKGIEGVLPIDRDFIGNQLDCVCSDIAPDAVKIGMLPDKGAMEAVVKAVLKYDLKNIVLDPVLSSTSGTELSRKEGREYLKKNLFPKCTLITPNIPEAEILSGIKIKSKKKMEEAAKSLSDTYGCNVLIKGGHSEFEANESSDLLCLVCGDDSEDAPITAARRKKHSTDSGSNMIWISGFRIDNPNTHGTGCTLSSAIASNLAKGHNLTSSVKKARQYIERCIAAGLEIGHGRGPLYHHK